MKILHTSDWHIGKQLHKIDLSEDIQLFFDWLTELIQKEKIDVLLMSGDLFDQANPSQHALRQYYTFLKKMLHLRCKVIITGGNHDSPLVLNAPKDILDALDIHVIGGATSDIKDIFIKVEKGGEQLVVAGVPFLRDKDIRKAAPGESYEDKIEQLRAGMETYFEEVNQYYTQHYDGIPFIIMAHLFAQGAVVSDSEREIQIGNQAGIESRIFGNKANYIALGHIHKPQSAGHEHIRYCGSPIPLSFSEKEDKKEVIIINIDKEKFDFSRLEVPRFRNLVLIKGDLESVKSKIEDYNSETPLADLAEIIVTEENESSTIISEYEEMITSEENVNLQLIKFKLVFKNAIEGTSSLLSEADDISSYKPMQLFEKRLEQEADLADVGQLKNAFREILSEIHEKE
ncbi:MAG: exonuclease subunit SbcD [Chitinophagaceae bacterium]|nr:MAG: exonuclease subunit SbcD [Chitinophagaceae bacterium]